MRFQERILLDFGFLELDMLPDNRIIFTEFQLLGCFARIFLGHIKIAGVRCAEQLDQNGGRLGHLYKSHVLQVNSGGEHTRLAYSVKGKLSE